MWAQYTIYESKKCHHKILNQYRHSLTRKYVQKVVSKLVSKFIENTHIPYKNWLSQDKITKNNDTIASNTDDIYNQIGRSNSKPIIDCKCCKLL